MGANGNDVTTDTIATASVGQSVWSAIEKPFACFADQTADVRLVTFAILRTMSAFARLIPALPSRPDIPAHALGFRL